MADPSKKERSNVESIRKPYLSQAASYEDFKNEIPDDDYYGQKHSEFKKPWLDTDGDYVTMEYNWNFPLPYINPYTTEIKPPDGGVKPLPGGIPWDPDWDQTHYNPWFPFPKPRPNPTVKKKPGDGQGETIMWDCKAPWGFDWCPGETISLSFEEGCSNPINGASGSGSSSSTIDPAPGSGETDTKSADNTRCKPGDATGTRQIRFTIPSNYTGSFYKVCATARNGSPCCTTGIKKSYCNESACADVSMGYDNVNMATGTTQDLTINNPKQGVQYEYKLNGGGTLSDTGGGGASYKAPDENPCVWTTRLLNFALRGPSRFARY